VLSLICLFRRCCISDEIGGERGDESGPSFRALVFAAGKVWGNLFLLLLSDLTWVLRDSGVLQCRPTIMFPWGVKDAINQGSVIVWQVIVAGCISHLSL
jgi:hypothetical protein